MWIFTIDGFFSAVQDKDDHSQILVRSRQLGDLETLLKKINREDLEIVTGVGTDYAHRVFIPRELWTKYLVKSGETLDYPNFKARAVAWSDHSRHQAYYDIWEILKKWQDGEPDRS